MRDPSLYQKHDMGDFPETDVDAGQSNMLRTKVNTSHRTYESDSEFGSRKKSGRFKTFKKERETSAKSFNNQNRTPAPQVEDTFPYNCVTLNKGDEGQVSCKICLSYIHIKRNTYMCIYTFIYLFTHSFYL